MFAGLRLTVCWYNGIVRDLRWSFLVAVALAAGVPGLGAALHGRWPVMLLFLAAGALWLGAHRRRWLAGWSWALSLGGLVVAIRLGVEMGWLLPGMAGALAAWDLDAFTARLASFSHIENEQRLVRAHLRRLGAVSGIGLLLGGVGLFIRMQLSFGLALIVASLAALGTAGVLHQLGREQEDEGGHVTPPA
jgi:cytochrome bd-type quinol oxidase subunit 2